MYRSHVGDMSRRRLAVFLLFSLCLHAGLIVRFAVAPRPVYRVEPPLSISLNLSVPPPEKPASVAAARPRTTNKPKTVVRAERVIAPTPAPELPPAASSEAKNAAPSDTNTDGPARPETALNDAIRGEVQALLLADLRRYFEYPLIARRRGWEGIVRLSVTVQPDGGLAAIRIVRSSGYDVLDRSAVAALQRVGQFAQAGERLHGRPLELPLSVVYRLTN
ncbi:MAG: TonB family protein [Sulfurifustis sp.]